jgi:DNA-binding transcriptional regulator LsrR (DeoR family)
MVLRRGLDQAGEELAKEGAVGDLSCCLFNSAGVEDPKHNWRFFLTPGHYDPAKRGIAFYRDMVANGKKVIVIAGHRKEMAILAALKGRLFNVLFTDNNTAEWLLEQP